MDWHKRPPHKEHYHQQQKRLGLIHVYTGEGKGKSTTALGIALRAVGHEMRVLIIQFLKGHKDYGEVLVQSRLRPHLEIVQFGTPDPVNLQDPTAMDMYLAKEAMEYARRAMIMKRPDILILDEINPALHHNFLPVQEVLDFLDNKHQNTEVILTGRNAPKDILNAADLITVMTMTKHPYHDGFIPRRGIEH